MLDEKSRPIARLFEHAQMRMNRYEQTALVVLLVRLHTAVRSAVPDPGLAYHSSEPTESWDRSLAD